jgi:16S rRNA (cytosine967-C5)-methyltransferase
MAAPARSGAARGGRTATATEARRCAHRVVERVFDEGAYADRAFRAEADRAALDARDRAFARRIAYGTMQRLVTLDHAIAACSDRAIEEIDRGVLHALRVGAFELLFLDAVPDRAAVGQAVELAALAQPRARGFANAVLRRAAREGRAAVAELRDDDPGGAAVAHSHPEWLVRRWWDELGPDETRALLRRDNEPAERAVRVNLTRATREEVLAALDAGGTEPRPAPDVPEGIVLGVPFDVAGSELFRDGLITPQSRGAMLVARVVAPRPGERVLDLCAAPGAKTTHLAELMGAAGHVVAIERHPGRARELRANVERTAAALIEVVCADARDADVGEGFDRVLLDAPCSDLGTLQSRPDARWRKSPDQVTELVALQRELLEAAALRVRPGGTVTYSICTISADEGRGQVERFVADRRDFTADDLGAEHPELRDPAAPEHLQTLPHRHGTDGFFVARLRRARP